MFKIKKQTMPDGWVHIKYKLDSKKIWTANIPENYLDQFEIDVYSKGGVITKIQR